MGRPSSLLSAGSPRAAQGVWGSPALLSSQVTRILSRCFLRSGGQLQGAAMLPTLVSMEGPGAAECSPC